MADITTHFKAAIKGVKSRKKSEGETLPIDKSLLNIKKKTQFTNKAKDVVQHIAKLEDFLVSHRKDYINAAGMLGRANSKMTDSERDQIDADAESFMRACHDAIKTLKIEAGRDKTSGQMREHRCAVLDSLDSYLKEVCRTYSAQRAIRVKRVVDRKKISRLEPESKKAKTFVSQLENKAPNRTGESKSRATTKTEDTQEIFVKRNIEEALAEKGKDTEKKIPANRISLFPEEEGDDFSPEDALELEQENIQLYKEMNSIVDEVKQIEGKVVEISRLQEFFADKVLEQEKDIDRVGDTVVGTVENIKDANDEIREAMRNNAGLRVWILFFLIVLSISLLFLDWYNP